MPDLGVNPVNTGPQATSSTDAALPVTDTNSQAAGASSLSAATPIKSLEDLKTKSPKLYEMMMQGIAFNICNEMKDSQERLKEMMRDAERQAEGH